jgi:hypothetical protein
MMNFKNDLISNLDIVAWWMLNKTENSNSNCKRMLRYNNPVLSLREMIMHPMENTAFHHTVAVST